MSGTSREIQQVQEHKSGSPGTVEILSPLAQVEASNERSKADAKIVIRQQIEESCTGPHKITRKTTEVEGELADAWRDLLRYSLIAFVVGLVLWKLVPAMEFMLPTLKRIVG
jgi:hypothetical protein